MTFYLFPMALTNVATVTHLFELFPKAMHLKLGLQYLFSLGQLEVVVRLPRDLRRRRENEAKGLL